MEISNTSSQSKTSSRSLKQWIQQHPLFSYFFLAYAISWIVFIPYVLWERGYLQGNYTFFYILHVFGPAVAAIVMTSVTAGKAGLHELRQRFRQVRTSSKWYLFILLGIPALVMLGIIVQPGAMSSFKGFTTQPSISYPFARRRFLYCGMGRTWLARLHYSYAKQYGYFREPYSWAFCGVAGTCPIF
jgi:hypothetical protein